MLVRSLTGPLVSPIARALAGLRRGGDGALAKYAAVASLSLASDSTVAFQKVSSTDYRLHRPIGDTGYWQEIRLTTGGVAGGPLAWSKTRINRVARYVLPLDAGMVFSGSWSVAGALNFSSYIAGSVRSTTKSDATAYATVTIDGGGDLYVVFTGRTTGSYVKVEIDGDTENANELPSNGSYRYIDTYTDPNLQYRQRVKVASGLPDGVHAVVLTAMGDRNPANVTGYHVMIEAVYMTGTGIYPGTESMDLPLWAASTAYAQYSAIRTTAGRYYICSVAGATGAGEPTHTTGDAADGTVTWRYAGTVSPFLYWHDLLISSSETDYAFQFKPSGASALEDIGGIAHGNETLASISVDVNGTGYADGDIAAGAWLYGDAITVTQTSNATHSEKGATVVATNSKAHTLTARELRLGHSHTFNVAGEVGFFYAAMWPLQHWDGVQDSRYAFDRLWTPKSGAHNASDYYGVAGQIVGNQDDLVMCASGNVLMPRGSAGTASTGDALKQAVAALYVTGESVNNYATAGSTKAGKAMNAQGNTPPGTKEVMMKMYFERSSTANPTAVSAGETWACKARYALSLADIGASLPF